ncbi:CDP-diacylglycerol--serine O-phosphatidyltransferase [Dethiobacter alkaliphilus]|uniref:CDP-diacylglycerol--serine O-phosphatidyltransferase n=1 Tax=Dethiobacter alkaliphilus AHT 1 TaxID=555088 RepID=C0GC68_DETAL|nr:CDP-diacylglycerol--serine O-phosphatidyltransferase [Dethiobacter alkaliphilus]EEG78803.1 CDP-diacylglycerol/serine O-phosphatidyltransferase [Dethiobacter alkaliphilus AHT 1]
MNKKKIPNIVTLANLALGTLALIHTIQYRCNLAAILILICAILDGMDGKLARRLNAVSAFGKELDSLADLVSFGVAPALLVYVVSLSQLSLFDILVTLAFVLCGAIRLARFNVSQPRKYFTGVPITIAGSILAGTILIHHFFALPLLVFPLIMISMSYLMVSKFKVPCWK